jgi:hypothetical protein
MRHLERVFIPNIVLTSNVVREGTEIHGVILEDGELVVTADHAKGDESAVLPDEWDYLGVSKAFVFLVMGDSPGARRTVCDLIVLHRGRFGTSSLHTEGSGSLIEWAQGGAIPPSEFAVEDVGAERGSEEFGGGVKAKKKDVKVAVRKKAPKKAVAKRAAKVKKDKA